MQITYKRVAEGFAEVNCGRFIITCDLDTGIAVTQNGKVIPLTSQHVAIWSQVADVLGGEFVKMDKAPDKMTQLISNGVLMPDESEALVDRMGLAWARKLDTPYVNDEVFKKNFLEDYEAAKKVCGRASTRSFHAWQEELKLRKTLKDAMTPEERKADRITRKERSEANKAKYGVAFVNGVKVSVANYRVEPSSIFMGRGLHPLRGHWKDSVSIEDIVLNLSPDAPTPVGFEKATRVWEPDKCYVAKWFDDFSEKWKYVWFGTDVPIRQGGDIAKFEKAEKLATNIKKVEAHIQEGLRSKDEFTRKVATATYLISLLGIRVGDEKDEDEADTVGSTTLRPEHIDFVENPTTHRTQVKLDFLGKDSVRFTKTFDVGCHALSNLHEFTGKAEKGALFEGVTSSDVGRFLSEACEGVTAKVFRTYIATSKVAKFLDAEIPSEDAEDVDKIFIAKKANLEAAIALNHKRAVPKNYDERLAEKKAKLAEMKAKGKDEEDASYRKLSYDIYITERTRDVALSTSLTNYIDPRVFFKYCEDHGLRPEQLYSKTLLKKMSWALQKEDEEE